MKTLVLTLAALLILTGSACFAEEAVEEKPIRDDLQIIQLKDPLEPLEDRIQKYFNMDTTYDHGEETTSIWTTFGLRKNTWDCSFTWDQQVNPDKLGRATFSVSIWW